MPSYLQGRALERALTHPKSLEVNSDTQQIDQITLFIRDEKTSRRAFNTTRQMRSRLLNGPALSSDVVSFGTKTEARPQRCATYLRCHKWRLAKPESGL